MDLYLNRFSGRGADLLASKGIANQPEQLGMEGKANLLLFVDAIARLTR